jgi:hypothetical protein
MWFGNTLNLLVRKIFGSQTSESNEWKTDVFNSIGRKQTLDLRQAVCP